MNYAIEYRMGLRAGDPAPVYEFGKPGDRINSPDRLKGHVRQISARKWEYQQVGCDDLYYGRSAKLAIAACSERAR